MIVYSFGVLRLIYYGVIDMARSLLVVLTVLSSPNEHLHNLTQPLLLHLLPGL